MQISIGANNVPFAFSILHFQLQWKEVQDPSKCDAADNERPEQLRAEAELLLGVVAHQRREHNRYEQREQNHETEV